jgi:hypothetical protein
MTDRQRLAEGALLLLKQAELSQEEVVGRLGSARDRNYWRRLVPFASVEAAAPPHDPVRLGRDAAEREVERLSRERYFDLGTIIDREQAAHLYRIIEAVRAAGWPPVFAMVFDAFWSLSSSPVLLDFLESCLGPGCLQNTVVWVHWVTAVAGNSGWTPHFDSLDQEETFLSTWLALSDATTDNGCMFLVRPNAIAGEIGQALDAQTPLAYAAVRDTLRNVVALPAPAGALIGWRGDVFHWGSVNAGSITPRVSLALEFRSRGAVPHRFEAPLIDPRDGPPPFALRLFAISKALREYSKFEPMMTRFRGLAERLWEETRAAS